MRKAGVKMQAGFHCDRRARMSKPQTPDVGDLTHQCGARGVNPVGVLRLTQGGIVLSADTSASDILCNLKQFSPLGKPLGDLLDWQDKPQIAAALDLARKGTGGHLVLGAVRPDAPLQRLDLTLLPLGAEGDILCSLRLLCDPVPAVLAMSADDIRSRAATVLETINKGIQVLGRDGTLLYQNVAAETMLGVSAQALGTAQAHDILHHSHADGSPYPLHDCPIYKTLTDGQRALWWMRCSFAPMAAPFRWNIPPCRCLMRQRRRISG
jgi:PAS domain-containing protein